MPHAPTRDHPLIQLGDPPGDQTNLQLSKQHRIWRPESESLYCQPRDPLKVQSPSVNFRGAPATSEATRGLRGEDAASLKPGSSVRTASLTTSRGLERGPLTCAFASRISKPLRSFETGLHSGKPQIRSITTSSCRGRETDLRIAHSHRVLRTGLFHAKALLHKRPWMLWVKTPGLRVLPKINTSSAVLLWKGG